MFEEALILLSEMVVVITQHLDVSFEIPVLQDILLEFAFVFIKLVDALSVRLLGIQVHSRRSRIDGDKIGAISRSVGLESCVGIETVLKVLIQRSLGHTHIVGEGVII